MEYRVTERARVSVVHIRGDIEITQALALREALGGLLAGTAEGVLVDLSEVSFIDSSGMGIFVNAHRRAAEQHVPFALAEPQELAGRIFELTRADRLLRIYPTVEEGLQAMTRTDPEVKGHAGAEGSE